MNATGTIFNKVQLEAFATMLLLGLRFEAGLSNESARDLSVNAVGIMAEFYRDGPPAYLMGDDEAEMDELADKIYEFLHEEIVGEAEGWRVALLQGAIARTLQTSFRRLGADLR